MQKNQPRFNNPSDRYDYLNWVAALPPSRCIHYHYELRADVVFIQLETRLGSSKNAVVGPADVTQYSFVTSREVHHIARYIDWRDHVAALIREMRAARSKTIKNKNLVTN